MRHEKAALLIQLAQVLATDAEGLTLDEMADRIGVGRRTVERMRDALWELFPQMEEVDAPPTKRWRIVGGLRKMFVMPVDAELAALDAAIELAGDAGDFRTMIGLKALARKVRAATAPSARTLIDRALAHDDMRANLARAGLI